MLVLRCLGRAIGYGISAAFGFLILRGVIWLGATFLEDVYEFRGRGEFLAAFDVVGTLGIFAVIIYGIMSPIWEEVKDRRNRRTAEAAAEAAAEAEEVARLQRHRAKQQWYYIEMVGLGDNSIALFESMPEYLKSAEEYLDQAEFDFSDGAFAPFWDSIEKAAKTLGRFDKGVQEIQENSSRYTDLIRNYEDVPPQFPLARKSVEKLSVGTATAERMIAIVRTAQRNFQFATIYEQRKTNQILVAGFTNLAQALDRMTWQITDSIDNLAGSVDSMASTLHESMNAIHSRLGDMAKSNAQRHDEVMKIESDWVAAANRALEMLDNIQHHRRPSL